ncbi:MULTISPECIES: TetR/AcrR family transcriptional regulator [Streptomyces]|jgi:AcrR family transcriptional regulator|uniref:TetR-family transcriptional regulator n=2 Tax=Streptomyces bottropensis TaxID=42235 RepID=M3ELT8_9ACTN|nr:MULTISPECIES: TetR/AcrR family transcriptional regulator [Streptomyces]EMF57396.1 TetR-family transcriptional regulator [Streptomyces bottropensis ATCC 25435]MZD17968.1 TetR family transcriptional regulator [Streptomyces sp. SID5476]
MSTEPSLDLPPAQQARSRLTQQRILEAGTALLEEGGTEALTVAAVASRAGVSVGSVYRRFAGKDRLIAALQHDMIEQFRADIIRRFAPLRTGPTVLVASAVTGLTQTFQAHERLMRVFITAGTTDPAVARMGSEASIDAGQVFRRFLEPIAPMIDAPEPELRLDVVFRLVFGACMNRLLHGENFESARPLTWQQLTEELVDIACLYLLGTPAQ